MTHNEFINQVKNYFGEIEKIRELSTTEKSMYAHAKLYDDAFVVSCVTKDDLQSQGYNVDNVTNDQMEEIADQMGDTFCDSGYWESLDAICNEMGIE